MGTDKSRSAGDKDAHSSNPKAFSPPNWLTLW
jgi:hypothetical protein